METTIWGLGFIGLKDLKNGNSKKSLSFPNVVMEPCWGGCPFFGSFRGSGSGVWDLGFRVLVLGLRI